MQKDEEVGKVAQATPIIISKALELFLALIVAEASNVAVSRGSKRVEAYHLKHAIETTEMLDFLKEIVEGVPDPSAGGTIDLDGENGEGGKKKRGKGKKSGPSDGPSPSHAPPVITMGDQPPKKKRKKKGETHAGSKATASGKPSRSIKTEAVTTEGDREHEMEERSDADQKMEDADEYEDDGYSGYGRSSRRSEPESERKEEEEDAPYMPRS